MMTFVLEFGVLGPLEVRRDGAVLALGAPKQRAVLGILLLAAGRVVSADALVDHVWGDEPPNSVLTSLQVYVSNLRRILRDDGPSPIVRQAPGYRCDVDAGQLDLARFVRLADEADRDLADERWEDASRSAAAALAGWRGPLLADFADQEWAREAAGPLASRREGCRQTQVTALLGIDRVPAAVTESARLVAENPYDERSCWLHVVGLHRMGRTADALAEMRQHTDRLDDELGLEPGPALRDLQGALLRQDPSLDSWPRRTARGGDPAVPAVIEPAHGEAEPVPGGAPHPSADGFVGRHDLLTEIGELLRPGRPSWIVLEGDAGIGKTRLAEVCAGRWAALGSDPSAVLRTSCPDDASLPAWWPLRSVLRDLGHDPDDLLVPPPGADADAARFATYDTLRTLLTAAAADRPLLLVVDDAHWADVSTLGFLTVLAESRPVPGLAILVTTRPPTGQTRSTAVARLLAAVVRAPAGRLMTVPPLSTPEVAELVAQVTGDAEDVPEAETLTERTSGNPFLVREYARLPDELRRAGGVPAAVRSVLDRRLSDIDSEVLRVLRVAALIGQRIDIELLRRVTRLEDDDLADLLDDAADQHLLVAGPDGRYQFVHALMREHVAAAVSGLRRGRLHQRIAEAHLERGGPDAVVQRAAHLMASMPLGDAAEVVAACGAAAREAEDRWQSDDAAYWWGEALRAAELLPADEVSGVRDELVLAQVAAYARAGRGATVLEAVDQALTAAMDAGRLNATGRVAALLLRSSGAWPWVVFGSEADNPLLRRITALERLVRDDPPTRVRVLAALAVGSCYDPDPTATDRLSREAVDLAESLGDPDLIADAILGRALAFSGVAPRAAENVALLDRLAALPHQLSAVDAVLCDNLGSQALLCLGRIDEALERIRRGTVASDRLRLPINRAQLRWMDATLTLWTGTDLDAASERIRHAFDIHRQTELYENWVFDLALLTLAWERGDLTAYFAETYQPGLPWMDALQIVLARGTGWEHVLRDEAGRAESVQWTSHGRLTLLAHLVADEELVDLAPGLRSRLARFSGFVANFGQVGIIGPVDLALARLSRLTGDLDDAAQYADGALSLAVSGGAVRHRLRAELLVWQIAADRGEQIDVASVTRLITDARAQGLDTVATAAHRLIPAW